jgi:Mitochondrial ribosomal protein L28
MKKDWSRYALARHRDAIFELDRKLLAQQEAMTQLRLESEHLYQGSYISARFKVLDPKLFIIDPDPTFQ